MFRRTTTTSIDSLTLFQRGLLQTKTYDKLPNIDVVRNIQQKSHNSVAE